MKYLIDTHVWLWLLQDPGKLAPRVRHALEAADDLVLSVASIWEAGIKVKLGKLSLPQGVAHARDEFLRQAGARELSIQSPHVMAASDLPPLHRDPFDRLLLGQSQVEQLVLVTADDAVRRYGLPIEWAI
jgi:PIN domain nuclease of toxin-antitoxin system